MRGNMSKITYSLHGIITVYVETYNTELIRDIEYQLREFRISEQAERKKICI